MNCLRILLIVVFSLFGSCAYCGDISPAFLRSNTPWILQKTQTDCGRAVLASLLSRGDEDAELAYSRIPDPADAKTGYSIAEMIAIADGERLRLTLRAPSGVSFSGSCAPRPEVLAYIKQLRTNASIGRPSIIPISNEQTSGHYVTIVASAYEQSVIRDPASPWLRVVQDEELIQMMCGFGFLSLEVQWTPQFEEQKLRREMQIALVPLPVARPVVLSTSVNPERVALADSKSEASLLDQTIPTGASVPESKSRPMILMDVRLPRARPAFLKKLDTKYAEATAGEVLIVPLPPRRPKIRQFLADNPKKKKMPAPLGTFLG